MALQVTQAAITEILRLHQHCSMEVNRGPADSTLLNGENISGSVQAQLDFVLGGCAEQRYQLNFDPASPGSQSVSCGPVALHISQAAWPYVQSLTLDYVEDLMGGSFRFDNPALPQTCNCGQSFHLIAENV